MSKPKLAYNKPPCEYAVNPARLAGPCSSSRTTHYVPYYFSARVKPVRRDRALYLCPKHADMWKCLHPFGPPAQELKP